MNSRKRFDPDDGKYGEEGEIAVARALTNSGYEVQHLPSGQYGPDLLVRSKAGEVFGVEVERRKGSSWRGGTFPYPEYNYPERRLKKMRAGDLLFVVSGGCEDALIIFGKDAVELLETVPGEFQTNRYAVHERIWKLDVLRCHPVKLSEQLPASLASLVEKHRSRIFATLLP